MKTLTLSILSLSFIFTQNLFISEYIEGGSYNKALEIFNPTDASVDLSAFELWKITNGGDWDEGAGNSLALEGSLPGGQVLVLCHNNAGDEIQAVCDVSTSAQAINFNGDDAIGLVYNGSLIDVIGEEGDDPGSGWDVAGTGDGTKDHTLVRKPTVTQGNLNWATSAGTSPEDSEWIVYEKDDFGYIGTHVCSECDGGGGGNFPPVAFTGDDQLAASGETVTLDGSGSYDPDGVIISYEWQQVSGDAVTLSDYESDIVTFTAPESGGTLEFQLTVWDEELEFDTDNIVVTVCSGLVSIQEARNAGVDQCLSVQGVVTSPNFQASNSEYTIQDASAGIVILVWDIDVGLNYGDEIMVTGTTDDYNGKFELVLDNPDNITIIGPGTLPDPQVVTIYEYLDNAESFESEVITLESVTLIDGTWPELDSWANLTISDGSNETTLRIDNDTDIDGSPEPTWPVNVTGLGGQYDFSDPPVGGYQVIARFVSDFEVSDGNMLPIANAGENQFVSDGDEVTLNGIYSYDPDGEIVGFTWTQTEGTSVTLSDYEEAEVTFTAPAEEGVLTFTLEVFDNNGASNSDDVSIIVMAGALEITEVQAANDMGEGYDCYPSPYNTEIVTVSGVVTAVQAGENPNFYIQDPNADSFGGIWVYDNTVGPNLGDELLVSAEVTEYYGLTELQNVMAATTLSVENVVASTTITTGELAEGCSLSGEAYEGMLVRLENVTVVSEINNYGEWTVDDGSGVCQIDDQMFDGEPEAFTTGTVISSITGVVDYAFSAYGVNPRNADDINLEGGCVPNGDTNEDGSIDILDVVQIVGAILSSIEFTDDQLCIADVNEDSSVDVLDVVVVVNIILTPRTEDATIGSLYQEGLDVYLSADGYIGAVQMTIAHSEDFDIKLTDNSFVAEYKTSGNITKLIIVAPSTDHLFTAMKDFEIQEVIATNSSNYINVDIPESFLLLSSYPNPFNPEVTLSYYLPSDSNVELAIYSMAGSKIATLTNGFQSKGNYQANWDGRDIMGNQVSSGIYLARLVNGNNEITNKITLLK